MGDLDRRLAEVSARQHGLITLDDVLAAGGRADHAQRRAASGRWERCSPGVFRIAGLPWSYPATVLAAVLSAGPGAVASHLCAARLLGIGFPRATPELSIPRGRRHRPEEVRVHESGDLDRCDIRIVDGVPVTDPARTILDVGRYLRVPALTRAAEEARRQGLVTWPELLDTLVGHARQGRHGITRLREVVAGGLRRSRITDTDSELMGLTLVRERGLEEPVLHHRVRNADGEIIAELDLAWPDRMAAIEIDGAVHLRPEVKQKDDARDHHLRELGWTIRRVWCEVPVEQPEAFLQIVRSLLRQSAAA